MTIIASLSLLWILGAVPRQAGPGPAPTSDRDQLMRLESDWNEAHLRADVAALDRLWADDLVVIVPKMAVMTKAQTLGVWRMGRMKFHRYETSDVAVRIYGDAAVVTGRVVRARIINGQDVVDDWRFTKVYIRGNGEWRIVAWHASESAAQ